MRFILYFGILSLISACKCHDISKDSQEHNILFNCKLIRSFDTISYFDTLPHKGYDIEFSLINKSNSPISFWIMTCSWDYNFIVNNDYIKFLGRDCDGNYPHIKQLKPNENAVFRASVIRYDFTIGQHVDNTRFGFIYIDSIYCKDYHEYLDIIHDKSKYDTIIWSNPLYLNDRK